MFDIEKLSTPAKVEAMRYGHSAVVNQQELVPFLDSTNGYLQKGEHFALTPLGSFAGTITMYSVRVVPAIKVEANGF